MTVKEGSIVKVEYEGRFENDEVFDSSAMHNNEPLGFQVGAGMVVPGFEKAVVGMKKGEEKEFTLKPEDAYGMPNPQAIQKFPRENFPSEAKEGMMIGVSAPNGQQFPAKIVKIEEDSVTLDLNHPMAGKVLIFKVKMIDFEEGKLEESSENESSE